MKYNILNSLKKIIILLLVTSFVMCFSSCNNDSDVSSEGELSSVESVDDSAFGADDAIALLELDKKVIDIFVNNSLCKDKSLEAVAVTSGEYVDFAAVESLIDSVYVSNSTSREMFFAYPEGHIPSISNADGKTFVFNHVGSKYDDFIQTSSVSVVDAENENEKIIKAKTESGKDVELKAVCENENWLLESSLFSVDKIDSKTDVKFPTSDYGSFMKYSGKVLVIELYVSDKESGFTAVEEKEFHNRIEKAFDYITEQAQTYGREVTVDYKPTYFEHFGTIGANSLDFDITFAETGFGSLQKFADANCDLAAYDNYVFVVCMDKEDVKTSFACYDGSDQTQLYFAERVIMGRNSTEVEVCVSALRLLGAYGFNEGVCDEYIESLYNAYFPYDILVSESLTFSTMSPVTAYACGITEDLNPLYRVFLYE